MAKGFGIGVSRNLTQLKACRQQAVSSVLQIRQRRINENIANWMTNRNLKGTLIVDACAGPEGSLWSIRDRGGNWLGNEISEADFALLSDTVGRLNSPKYQAINRDAHRTGIKRKSADYYMFILALNHLKVGEALSEGKRVIKDEGRIVIADTGPTYWIMEVMLYSALKHMTGVRRSAADALIQSRRSLQRNMDVFQERVLDPGQLSLYQYTTFMLDQNFGIPRAEEFIDRVNKSLRRPESVGHAWWHSQRSILDGYYWNNVFDRIHAIGLSITRMGIMPAIEIKHDGQVDWIVGDIVDCEINQSNAYVSEANNIIPKAARKQLAGKHRARKVLFTRTFLAKKN